MATKFKNPHWFKETRTPAQRRKIYRKARKLGMNYSLAKRVQDWSDNHIAEIFKNYPLIASGGNLGHRIEKEGEFVA